jgi:hypothetical protein
MCGPHFCSMQITQEVRDYAAAHHLDAATALAAGMEECSATCHSPHKATSRFAQLTS